MRFDSVQSAGLLTRLGPPQHRDVFCIYRREVVIAFVSKARDQPEAWEPEPLQSVTEAALRTAFSVVSEELVVPQLDKVEWHNRDFLGWVHPAGHRAYLLHESPIDGSLRGTVLRRSSWMGKRRSMEMCNWCYHMHQAGGTAMFTVTRRGTGGRHIIGNVVCKDLDCSLRIRNLVEPRSYFAETMHLPARIWRMQRAMHKWLKKAERL